MFTARSAAIVFVAALMVLVGFQIALVLGAPWGRFAMGGAVEGAYPPAMRVTAAVQILIYGAMGVAVVARAGLALRRWHRVSIVAIWIVVAILAVSLVLNLITPSGGERLLWAPVAAVMLFASLRVALSPKRI